MHTIQKSMEKWNYRNGFKIELWLQMTRDRIYNGRKGSELKMGNFETTDIRGALGLPSYCIVGTESKGSGGDLFQYNCKVGANPKGYGLKKYKTTVEAN